MTTAEQFLERGERCLQLAKLCREAADELDRFGHELMAKAVELDYRRESEKRKPAPSDHKK